MTADASAALQPYPVLAITGSEEAVLPNGLNIAIDTSGNLLANSGFELPALTGTQFQYGAVDPTGSWTFDVRSGVSRNGSGFTNQNRPAPQGNQVAFIQGTSTISQVVNDLIPGASYVVSFSAAGRVAYTPQAIDLQIANVDGSAPADLGVYSFGNSDPAYYPYTTPIFSRAVTSARITIKGLVPFGPADATVFLDNIQIIPVP